MEKNQIDSLYSVDSLKFMLKLYHFKQFKYPSKISFKEFFELSDEEYKLIEPFFEMDEIRSLSRSYQKERLEYFTKSVEEKIADERKHGQLWIVLERFKHEAMNESGDFAKLLDALKEKVMPLLSEEVDKESYQLFLAYFERLWNSLYVKLCMMEYDCLKYKKIDGYANCFYVGFDELLGANKENAFIFRISEYFANQINGVPSEYMFDVHMAIFANYAGFDYRLNKDHPIPSLTFKTTARLEKFKQDFYQDLDQKFKSGERTDTLIGYDEIVDYVSRALKPYNSYVREHNHE